MNENNEEELVNVLKSLENDNTEDKVIHILIGENKKIYNKTMNTGGFVKVNIKLIKKFNIKLIEKFNIDFPITGILLTSYWIFIFYFFPSISSNLPFSL